MVASYVLRRLPTPVESCMLTFALIGIVLALAELDARLRKVLPKMLTELATSSSFFTHIDTDYTVMRGECRSAKGSEVQLMTKLLYK